MGAVIAAILRMLTSAIIKAIIRKLIWWIVGALLAVLVGAFRDQIEAWLGEMNNSVLAKTQNVSDYGWGMLQAMRDAINPYFDEIKQWVDDALSDPRIDWLLGLADVAAEIEAWVQSILNVIIAALEAWLEGLLNPVSEAIIYVVTKLGEIEGRIAGIRGAVNDAISLGTVQIGSFAAADLSPGVAYTQAELDAHGERVASYARDVALVSLGQIDWDLGLQDLVDRLTGAGDAVRGVIEGAEAWVMTALQVQIRAHIAEAIESIFIVAWARRIDEFRVNLTAQIELKKGLIDQWIVEKRVAWLEEIESWKQKLADGEKYVLDSIIARDWTPEGDVAAEQLASDTAFIDQTIQQIDVSELVEDDAQVDSILTQLPVLVHEDGPTYEWPEKWTIRDFYRMLVHYASRPQRLAIMVLIARYDMHVNIIGSDDAAA